MAQPFSRVIVFYCQFFKIKVFCQGFVTLWLLFCELVFSACWHFQVYKGNVIKCQLRTKSSIDIDGKPEELAVTAFCLEAIRKAGNFSINGMQYCIFSLKAGFNIIVRSLKRIADSLGSS